MDEGKIYGKNQNSHLLPAARVRLSKYWKSLVHAYKRRTGFKNRICFVLLMDKLSAINNVTNVLVDAMEKLKMTMEENFGLLGGGIQPSMQICYQILELL